MSKRLMCSGCERPLKTCLCDTLVELSCDYQLIILQDPKEAKHALSSAPILTRSITGARLLVGEEFDPVLLFGEKWKQESILVFPSDDSLSTSTASKLTFKNLILIDGTWRKVARLLHLNPWLSEIPSIAIESSHSSKYTIRKSPREDGLSTIEAAVQVLNDLNNEKDFTPILAAFHKMIHLQIEAMGKEKFENNYLK